MRGNNNKLLAALVMSGIVLGLPVDLRAQHDSLLNRSANLRADVKMILVPVNVVDHKGSTVSGLRAGDFTLLDEKVPQKIVSFSSEDAPCSVGLVLDLSGSMKNSLGSAKEALGAFLGTANPQDEFLLLGISSKPVVYPVGTMEDVNEFTGDAGTIQNSIQLAPAGGSTALVDTIWSALAKMHAAHNPKRALVIISDGMDNHSRHTLRELLRYAEEADVQIHTIALDRVPRESKAINQIEARRGLDALAELADRTGGVHLVIRDRGEAQAAAGRIGLAIRNQYLIGFQPQNPDSSGKWHRVQVKLDHDRMNVYARSGYHAN